MQNRHDEFRRITFLLLYPTVYDTATAAVDEDEELAGELVRDAAARGDSLRQAADSYVAVCQVETEEIKECLADVHAALEQLTLHRAVLQLVDEARSTEKAENVMETVERFFMVTPTPTHPSVLSPLTCSRSVRSKTAVRSSIFCLATWC